jgi:Domain of unknown function (DUF4383)
MAKLVATGLGVAFLIVGIVGFLAPDIMGMHLSMAHNLIHLVSGALALWVGLAGSYSAARSFCIFFGLVYGLLGVLGFILGNPEPERMLTVIPDQLMFGRMDHIVHIVLGALFLIGGLVGRPVPATTNVPAEERR